MNSRNWYPCGSRPPQPAKAGPVYGRNFRLQSGLSHVEVEFLELLALGDQVEIFDHRGNVEWQGVVEEIAPALGVAWIRTGMGERKLLDIREHSVRRFPR
jgi:hypothetical protein